MFARIALWCVRHISSKEEKHTVLSQAVQHLYPVMDEGTLLRKTSKGYVYEGRVLDQVEVNELVEQAKLIQDLRLWNMIDAHVQQMAGKKMFFEAQTLDDLIAGKLILYTWDIQKSKLQQIV